MSLKIKALPNVNPYKSIKKATFNDLQIIASKAYKKVEGMPILPEDSFSREVMSFCLCLVNAKTELINMMKNGNKSVKNLGDLYISFKDKLRIEKAEKIGDALHTAIARTDFTGHNEHLPFSR